MTAWDIAVVGGGPAGAATAIGALRADPSLRVAVLDRADFPRDKSCGDGIAPHVIDLLTEAGVDRDRRRLDAGPPAAAQPRVPRRRRRHAAADLGHPPRGLRPPAGRGGAEGRAPSWSATGSARCHGTTLDGRRTPRRSSSAPTALTPWSDAPSACAGADGRGDPRLRPDAPVPPRPTGHRLRRRPATGVRLVLRPRRRPLQHRVRRAPRRRAEADPRAPARAGRGAAARLDRGRDRLGRPPAAALVRARRPSSGTGAARRRRRRAGEPDDRRGHLLRRRHRAVRRPRGRRGRSRRAIPAPPGDRHARTTKALLGGHLRHIAVAGRLCAAARCWTRACARRPRQARLRRPRRARPGRTDGSPAARPRAWPASWWAARTHRHDDTPPRRHRA